MQNVTNTSKEMFLGRHIIASHHFKLKGTFESHWAAQGWCSSNGYSCGSSDVGQIIALRKGEYDLPQKWKNFDKEDKESIDGVMYSTDRREGETTIYIFK